MSDLAASEAPVAAETVPAVVEAPVVVQPAAEAPVVEAPAAAVAPEATPETLPVVESPAQPAEPIKTESLLADAEAKPETQPEATPESVAPVAFEPLTLPEGVKLDDAKLSEFDGILQKYATEKGVPHDVLAALRVEVMDLYVKEQTVAAEQSRTLQTENWNRMQDSWKDEVRKAADIGGTKLESTLRQAGAVIEHYGSVMGREHETALREAFRLTGAGNHPAMIRFMNWASQFGGERARPIMATGPKPQVPGSRAQRRYAASNGAA